MTENKRFTMCHEQNDINGWTMSIVDWQTKEPFNYTTYEVHSSSINDTKDEMEDLCLLLNEQHEQIERLKDNFRALDEVKCELAYENEQLKQYKQSVNDVLKSWSQKNLTAKQLQVVLAIMEELNVIGDVE